MNSITLQKRALAQWGSLTLEPIVECFELTMLETMQLNATYLIHTNRLHWCSVLLFNAMEICTDSKAYVWESLVVKLQKHVSTEYFVRELGKKANEGERVDKAAEGSKIYSVRTINGSAEWHHDVEKLRLKALRAKLLR